MGGVKTWMDLGSGRKVKHTIDPASMRYSDLLHLGVATHYDSVSNSISHGSSIGLKLVMTEGTLSSASFS